MKIPPRRRAREVALQGLYQWQVNPATVRVILENLSELEHYGSADLDFLRTLLDGVVKQHAALEARIDLLQIVLLGRGLRSHRSRGVQATVRVAQIFDGHVASEARAGSAPAERPCCRPER